MSELIPIDELRDNLVWLIPKLDQYDACIEVGWDGGSDCQYGSITLVYRSAENSCIPNEEYPHEQFSVDSLDQSVQRIWEHTANSLTTYCLDRFEVPSAGPPSYIGAIRLELADNNDVVCEVRKYHHYDDCATDYLFEYDEGAWGGFSDDGGFVATELLPSKPLELKDCELCLRILEDLGLEKVSFSACWSFVGKSTEHDISFNVPLGTEEPTEEIKQMLNAKVLHLFLNAYAGTIENFDIDISGRLQDNGLFIELVDIGQFELYSDLVVGEKVPLFVDGVWYKPTVPKSDPITSFEIDDTSDEGVEQVPQSFGQRVWTKLKGLFR